MKTCRIMLIALMLAHTLNLLALQPTTIVLPETGETVSLTFTSNGEGAYRSLRIDTKSSHTDMKVKNPFIRIPAELEERQSRGIWTDIPGLKLDRSRYFLRGQYLSASKPHTLLFFVSMAYASNAAPLLVLGFSDDGVPFKVLERDEFDVTSFRAMPDGSAVIVGKPSVSQGMGCEDNPSSATTYDPYSVLILRPGEKAVLSPAESERYNRQNYVWAGPNVREDYAVVYNLPGHKKIFGTPASRLSALLHCRP